MKTQPVSDFIIALSPTEKLVLFLLTLAVLVSGTVLLYRANQTVLVEMPRTGGIYTEALAGTPRFINPLLARSNADRDLTTLVYAGLMTRDRNGELVPELASWYEVSEDGTQYTFHLREGLTFHDGESLTAEDVVFTVEYAGTQALLSPVYANWNGAVVQAPDAQTVVFTLPEPYAPFIENTTLGILPKHLWEGVTVDEFQFSQLNISPIGAGPYKVARITRNKSGIPEGYELTAFSEYVLGTPHIATLRFTLFDTQAEAVDAFAKGLVDAVGGASPAQADLLVSSHAVANMALYRAPMLRSITMFYNQNRVPAFLRDEVRQALELTTPKEQIIGTVLRGFGTSQDSPLPPYIAARADAYMAENASLEEGADETPADAASTSTPSERMVEAEALLQRRGWEKDEDTGIYVRETDDETVQLSFSISTVNIPELVATAELIRERWSTLGAEVEIKVYDPLDLEQSVIRPRQFDVLLYGVVPGHELDLYAYWHSSQRNDPGLNVGQYADIEADALLANLRTEQDPDARLNLYASFAALASKQRAAIFLYTPDYIYLTNDRVHNIRLHPIAESSERFDGIHAWHIDSDRVWPFVESLIDQ